MGGEVARTLDARDIPVIAVGALRAGEPAALCDVAARMLAAAEHLGFFYVTDHGIATSVLARAESEARAFFALPTEQKLAVAVNHRHRGFLRMGEATMHGARQPDLKESFVWGLEIDAADAGITPENPFLGENNWPLNRPGFRSALRDLFDAMSAVGIDLLRAFAVSVGIDERIFVRQFERPVSRGSVIYYPPRQRGMEEGRFGVSPHTDFGCLTVLYQDPVGGLEVRNREGEWVTATPIDGTFVVNVGDLLARWTNDRFVSTEHRVVNRSGCERLSMGVFVDPDFETVIDPAVVCRDGESPRHPPVRAGDYVLERYAGAFAYRQQ